jgi:hypothetical protein
MYRLSGYRTTSADDIEPVFEAGPFPDSVPDAVIAAAIAAHPHISCWRVEDEPEQADGDEDA